MKIAAIQLCSKEDIQQNLLETEKLIRAAHAEGAIFIATPEITDQVIANRADKMEEHFFQDDHPGVAFFGALSEELNITLLIGSMCVRISQKKLANRSFLFSDTGALITTYDKIHLYDVDLPNGESHRESNSFKGGKEAVFSEINGHKLAMTICYDMRFPHYFRDLAKAGAGIIAVPSAFTVPTGKAHWHILLRARAIETGCFIIAPAQVGDHNGVRHTYGHSIIIDPWGQILAEADGDMTGFITADIDFERVKTARQAIPSLLHDREYVEKLTN